jgi:PEP-CTERM motif
LQVDVGPGTGGNYEVGLRTAGASITMDTGAQLSSNITYLVVVEYNFAGSGTASLYLDPVAGGNQPGSAGVSLAGNGSVTAIDDVGFKAQSTTAGTFLIDNLLIGTTWADVTPAASPVPEPQTYALVLAGISLLGVTHVRRMRRACAK